MSEQVEMEEDDKGTTLANSSNQSGEKKRFEVKKVFIYLFLKRLLNRRGSKMVFFIYKVERRSLMGMGYCSRQLCYLP